MTRITDTLIKECELTKDILWYLRGAKHNDDFPFDDSHIKALNDLINYVQNIELIGVRNDT